MADIDPRTPVLVGVGQAVERIDDGSYRGLSPIDLAVLAARAAIADTKAEHRAVLEAIDTIACTRQFEDSTPISQAPLGKSTRFPLSVSTRLGLRPRRAVLEVIGGQSPQHLVNEFAREILAGNAGAVLLAGAEAISTTRHLSKSEVRPDFSDDPADPSGIFEDRGFGLRGLVTMEEVAHGLNSPPLQYALLENARRAALHRSRPEHALSMGELFAPFTRVAADNPYSASRQRHSAEELITVTDRNRLIADPYPRFLVSRDQVNQAAAVLMMSVATAQRLGIAEHEWVFLHGQADVRERELLRRPQLGEAPSAPAAVRHALEVAGVDLGEIDHFDFYSCFPIAVSNITDDLGLSANDPRGLTMTGGLPYFGGAGNNYSMHAIAEAVRLVRTQPGSRALVCANGGLMSKTSVGIYGTAPAPLRPDDSDTLQRLLDAAPTPASVRQPTGWATIETFTIDRGQNDTGIVIGRLDDGSRFIAQVAEGDDELLAALETDEQPIGRRIYVTARGSGNRVTTSETVANELFPGRPAQLQAEYEFLRVRRDGHLLEVTINRPEARNALHPPANEELEAVFDAYFADRDLWVAIITGAGDKAFSAGNDLAYTASGKLTYTPLSGFGGLTTRRGMDKPVIAAVNGFAMGGGFEIALACHLVVADERATFALSEVRVGLIAGEGGLVRLPRSIPPKIANELILTGRRMSTEEAERLGLVNRVAPAGRAMEFARALAAEILAGSPTSVRLSLASMNATQGIGDPVEAVSHPTDAIDQLLTSADALEGVMAFINKRPPRWKNL